MGRNASTLIKIILQDVNDNIPIFEPKIYNISIGINNNNNIGIDINNYQINTYLVKVLASDKDEGLYGDIRYEIKNEASKYFVIDNKEDKGNIIIVKNLKDYLKDSLVKSFVVEAIDQDNLRSNEQAIVNIIGINDHIIPEFTQKLYTFNVSEDILPGISIGQVILQNSNEDYYYEIYDGNDSNMFSIEESDGSITVSRYLDADHKDSILLNIVGISKNDKIRVYCQVMIYVIDENNNPPIFEEPLGNIFVPEDFPLHEPFFSLQATDKDRHENGKVTYEILDSHPPCPVIIRPLTGELILAATLDYEEVKEYDIKIKAQDQGLPPKYSTIDIKLVVTDVNDNPPIFESSLYLATVNEDTEVMSEIITVKAKDIDNEKNSKIIYSILKDYTKSDEFFGINQNTGTIFLRKPLDREINFEHSLTIIATDKGKPPLNSTTTVKVNVLDVNDNPPNCASIVSPFYLTDDEEYDEKMEKRDIPLGKINAYDADENENAIIFYRLQQANENFEIRKNGDIYLRRKPSEICLSSPNHIVSIIAEDNGMPSLSSVCLIEIKCEKEKSLITISEPFMKTLYIPSKCLNKDGCYLTKINGTNINNITIDKDLIINFHNYFIINNNSEIWIRGGSEINESLLLKGNNRLNLSLYDKNNKKKRINFIIKSLYVQELINGNKKTNKNDTILLKLSEKLLIGTKLITLEKRNDKGKYYYKILTKDSHFTINENDGSIYLSKRFNYNDQQIYELRIKRFSTNEDFEEMNNEILIIIDVQSENLYYPVFSKALEIFNISENASPGFLVGRINATDYDSGINGAIEYKLYRENDIFSVDKITGEIFLKSKLNYHTMKEYILVIGASDKSKSIKERKQSLTTIIVNVKNENNHAPTFVSITNVSVSENQLSSEPFHFVSAIDKDVDYGKVFYEIDNTENFRIDNLTGALYLISRSGLEKQYITVKAYDNGNPPKYNLQKIEVHFISTPNKWIYFEKSVYRFSVDKNIGKEHVTLNSFKQRTTDRTKENIKFKIYPEIDEIKNIFSIGYRDGILKANKGLMNKKEYEFNIYAYNENNSRNSDWTTIKLEVENIDTDNVEPLNIVSSSCGNVTIPENMSMKNFKRIFVISSKYENLNFKIEAGNDGGLFNIDTKLGTISCKELDYEAKKEHLLIISVTNMESKPPKGDTCAVRIFVADVNDNVPQFPHNMKDTIVLLDNTPINWSFMRLEGKDFDSGRNSELQYSLIDDEKGIFDVLSDTGDLILASLRNVQDKEWSITVGVQDNGAYRILSSTRQIRVINNRTISSSNHSNSPLFLRQKYLGYVSESLPKGEFVMHLSNDIFTSLSLKEAPISYSIIGGNRDSAFEIDNLGRIKTSKELDAEIEDQYLLNVIATNEFSKQFSTMVKIHVLNINDNVPFFPSQRPKTISENTPVGTLIATVTATDVDDDSFLLYSINPANEYFEIEPFTGEIYLKNSLDYEILKEHNLGIQAFDGEYTSRTNLKIYIIDENDNKPLFVGGSFQQIYVADNSPPNSIIHTIIAKDPDDGDNGAIKYKIINEEDDYFSLNEKTGVLTLLKQLMEGTHYIMSIVAEDCGIIKQKNILTLKIQSISGKEMRIPTFKDKTLNITVNENAPLFETIGKLQLTEGYHTPIDFVIKDIESAKMFYINNQGFISPKNKLERKVKKNYSFNVYMSKYSEVLPILVHINIADINNHSPLFLSNSTKNIKLNEKILKNSVVGRVIATDEDENRNGQITYTILSGNYYNTLSINSDSGRIIFEKWNDEIFYQERTNNHDLIIMAEDNGTPSRWSTTSINIQYDLKNWSGMIPFFVMNCYTFYLPEDTFINTIIGSVKATNKLGYHGDDWNYSLSNNPNIFGINVVSGDLILKESLDYEKRNNYEFNVVVKDSKDRTSIVQVKIFVTPVDEYSPVFSKSSYTFQLPTGADVGFIIGTIKATDNDKGSHGKIHYSIYGANNNIKMIGIDPNTGVLILRESMKNKVIKGNKTLEHLIVEASSSYTQTSRVNVYLEIGNFDISNNISQQYNDFNYYAIIILSLISSIVIVVIIILCCYRLCKNSPKQSKKLPTIGNNGIGGEKINDISHLSDHYNNSPNYNKFIMQAPPMFLKSSNSNSSQMTSSSNGYKEGALPSIAYRFPITNISRDRSHPDSGIDPDVLSINSTVTEYLSNIGITPLSKFTDTSFPKNKHSFLKNNNPQEFPDFMYSKIDELLGSNNDITSPNFKASTFLVKKPVIIDNIINSNIPKLNNYNNYYNNINNDPAMPQFRSLGEVFSNINKVKEKHV
ncbi:Protocadherin-23 [Strongyloides ratti]|uniref:Protocadherin-23 n=1 Tax=Strongyloides ratti TaxID=34506 RepID=A0A090LHF7_STRRB|nr:Protocadherin-23 [Strongyloides ratti]CEF67588.1 Protocadherin-23 [Strongyloides ratti]